MFKAIVFDIGGTLIEYNKPLSWVNSYRPALSHMADIYGYKLSERDYEQAIDILTKYNTRINPREYEVSSTQIFSEIVEKINIPIADLEKVKQGFYTFFRREVTVYPEVAEALKKLRKDGIMLGTLSDVPYGMDNVYVLEDIASLIEYIDYPSTSNDVGYRKPSTRGLLLLAEKMGVSPSEMLFVGDEEKDMICAKKAGAYAVLINRDGKAVDSVCNKSITSLVELIEFVTVQRRSKHLLLRS